MKLSFLFLFLFFFQITTAQEVANKFTLSSGGGTFFANRGVVLDLTADYTFLTTSSNIQLQGVFSAFWNPSSGQRIVINPNGQIVLENGLPSRGSSVALGVTGKHQLRESRWTLGTGLMLARTNFINDFIVVDESPQGFDRISSFSEKAPTRYSPIIPLQIYCQFFEAPNYEMGLMANVQWIMRTYKGRAGLNIYFSF